MLHIPDSYTIDPAFKPLLALGEALLFTTADVAQHYRYSEQSLANARRLGTGPAYVKLPSGGVRYRFSELMAWEISGHGGMVTPERLELAAATLPGLSPSARSAIAAHLNSVLFQKR